MVWAIAGSHVQKCFHGAERTALETPRPTSVPMTRVSITAGDFPVIGTTARQVHFLDFLRIIEVRILTYRKRRVKLLEIPSPPLIAERQRRRAENRLLCGSGSLRRVFLSPRSRAVNANSHRHAVPFVGRLLLETPHCRVATAIRPRRDQGGQKRDMSDIERMGESHHSPSRLNRTRPVFVHEPADASRRSCDGPTHGRPHEDIPRGAAISAGNVPLGEGEECACVNAAGGATVQDLLRVCRLGTCTFSFQGKGGANMSRSGCGAVPSHP
jgi:hypothetical protein